MKNLLIALATVVLMTACGKLTKENYDKIAVGMDYNEVTTLLGKADDCQDAMIGKTCTWGDADKYIKVTFVSDKTTVYTSKGII